MIELREIEKRFDAVVALNKASMTASPGKISALLGSNGSGKSTMIKILAGVYGADKGQILVDDKPITISSGRDSRKHAIATAFQERSLIPSMSVVDNLLLGDLPINKFGIVDRKKARHLILETLERFNIDCDPDAYVQTLMPSTQTMLEMAKAVLQKPRLLLLDEVTAPLHYDEIQVLFKVIRELKAEGMAIIYVTHRMNEVFELCDTVTVLRGGEVVSDGLTSNLTLDDIVYHMTGKRPESHGGHEARSYTFENKGEPLLDARDLEVYPNVWDVSVKAYKGEIVGIAGLQGQGQSEFMRAMLGAEEISNGTITFKGEKVTFKSPTKAVKNGLGFVSGDRGKEAIFATRPISENIGAGKVAKGNIAAYMTPKSMNRFAQDAVEKYNIKIGNLRDMANTLSGGNQQKLVIARWIAMNPDLLLLDDPTKGVDIHSRQEIHKILQQCASDGMTVIVSSSEHEELLQFADRIYVFYEGYVSDMLEGERLSDEHVVAAMMGLTQDGKGEDANESN